MKAETENDEGLRVIVLVYLARRSTLVVIFSEMQLYKNVSESARGVLNYRSVYVFAKRMNQKSHMNARQISLQHNPHT